MEKQFQNFFADKNIVNLSSYKVDTKTGEPLKYLKDQKETLWQKFFEMYPTGMKRTTFLARLKDGPYVYREDLGGLCSICSDYGYDVFDDLRNLITEKISEKTQQVNIIFFNNILAEFGMKIVKKRNYQLCNVIIYVFIKFLINRKYVHQNYKNY